ncbi:MAG TPA: hypothetical protein PLX69_22765 [Leptospiraceae bacterium]|nr:hypothetical protein [Leptospiraceae bacterium]HRG77400.1 hypothetical protein [Leptospiraceae bacterium]
MWSKLILFVLFLSVFNTCGSVNSCRNNCKTNAYACYLLFTDNTVPQNNKILGFLFCQILESDCNGKCGGGSGSSTSSSRSSSSSSGSRSSGGGSSSSGGGSSSGGSGGSSHEISPAF